MPLWKRFHNARVHSNCRKANCRRHLADDLKELEPSAGIEVAVEFALLAWVKSGIVLMWYMSRGELRAELVRFSGDNFQQSSSVLAGGANATVRTLSFPGAPVHWQIRCVRGATEVGFGCDGSKSGIPLQSSRVHFSDQQEGRNGNSGWSETASNGGNYPHVSQDECTSLCRRGVDFDGSLFAF